MGHIVQFQGPLQTIIKMQNNEESQFLANNLLFYFMPGFNNMNMLNHMNMGFNNFGGFNNGMFGGMNNGGEFFTLSLIALWPLMF